MRDDCVSGTGSAGYYGSLGPCDVPIQTLQDTFTFMAKTLPNPDFILYTGDVVPHAPLNWDENGVLEYIGNVSSWFTTYFPGTTVFPVLGNHDTYPEYQMYPYEYWLYDQTAEIWSDFLDSDMQSTFKLGGYYTHLISPGLRVVALNTALYYSYNTYVNPQVHTDPAGQLAWMASVMDSAKANGEKVIVIYHVPTGYVGGIISPMHKVYNEELVTALEPYNSIIIGHFSGHDHLDMFRLLGPDLTATSEVSVGFVAGSLSPWYLANPRIRMFSYQVSAPFTMLDYTSYQFDLLLANELRRSTWFVEYTARAEYNLVDLSSSSIIQLYNEMQTNITLVDLYLKHWKGTEKPGELCADLDWCRLASVCSIGTSQWKPWLECMSPK